MFCAFNIKKKIKVVSKTFSFIFLFVQTTYLPALAMMDLPQPFPHLVLTVVIPPVQVRMIIEELFNNLIHISLCASVKVAFLTII